jgi:hypothetical protein
MRTFLPGCLIAALGLFAMMMADVAAQDLSGRWYGEGYQFRRYLHWNADRRSDGSLRVEFRRYEDCVLVEQWDEAGFWAMSGNLYRTGITHVAGKPRTRIEEYIIESVGMNIMQYRHVRSGTPFTAVKLTGKEPHWPDCDKDKLTS